MKILIIEDEPRSAASLERIIKEMKPEVDIIGKCQSIEASVKFLAGHILPDLIFMDIQLADGIAFEIFKQVEVLAPVIFCTAFDAYSIQAFKQNGIDYILKPFTGEDIEKALDKVEHLSRFYKKNTQMDFTDLVTRLTMPAGKSNFLVFHQQKYLSIATETIAFFYVQHGATCIMDFEQKEYVINQSLDQVAVQVSDRQFFRANRQYLVNFKAIKQVEPFFMRKLYIKLLFDTKEKILVNKEKAPKLLAWMENR
jgi:DNA-binding LytR/AlgR family response regulator